MLRHWARLRQEIANDESLNLSVCAQTISQVHYLQRLMGRTYTPKSPTKAFLSPYFEVLRVVYSDSYPSLFGYGGGG